MTTGDFCRLQKILHVGDGEALERLLGGAGAALTDQISGCDFIVLRNARDKEFRRLRQLLRGLNPGVSVLRSDWLRDIEKALQKPRPAPNTFFLLGLVYFCVAYLLLRLVLGGTRVDGVVNVFLGILLQAVPFLLIGVLLSSAIQVFISDKLIAEKFPKHPAGGFLFALLAGFCLPVCDCTSIPVFRSIVRKGVPLSGAKFKSDVLTGGGLGALCGCGCAADPGAGKLESFMLHAQSEFFSVGKYLLLGAFVSALFQTMGAGLSRTGAGEGLLLPLLLMMAMAFLFSLCSSSDAVVARSFAAQFPMGALMGFLVFGPMMDVKNVLMLSGSFSKKFVLRLAFTMFAVCGAVVFAAFSLGLGEVLV